MRAEAFVLFVTAASLHDGLKDKNYTHTHADIIPHTRELSFIYQAACETPLTVVMRFIKAW